MLTLQHSHTLCLLLLLRVGGAVNLDMFGAMTTTSSVHSVDHRLSLSDALGQIFDSENGCDFFILVQSETENVSEDGTPETAVKTFCAHKIILLQFPLFNASEGTTSITVSISQPCQQHFKAFIRYLYTRKLDVTFSSVQCHHWLASQFGAKQLMEDAGRLFSKILPEDTSFHTQLSLYEYARETGDLLLQEYCIQYLAWNYQNLSRSPAWTKVSVDLFRGLLARTDLVVPDEYFLLHTVESWIMEKGSSTSLETQADLLSHIRFPMIPAEKLYDLETNSPLYSTHKNMYREKMLKAFQFNVLLFGQLQSSSNFKKEDPDYRSRIYTAEPWSTMVDLLKKAPEPVPSYPSHRSHYGSFNRRRYYVHPTPSPTMTESFSTPVHNSLIFKKDQIRWEANVLKKEQDCQIRGLRCDSLPVARLVSQNQHSQSKVIFRNRLLLMCQGKYICQVQDFKDGMSPISVNGTHHFAYPCPDDQYIYHFVVRPEYI